MDYSKVTDWCHEIMSTQAKKNGIYIDATMGKGYDTLFLCKLAGETGRVLSFDVQIEAIEATKSLLETHKMDKRAQLFVDGHEHMDNYAAKETIDIICFNFGYLPGGNHKISTKSKTSITAIEKGLLLLKSGGMMSLCIYSGGDTGFEEKQSILSYIKELSARSYTVIVNDYFNLENHPPMPVFIFKK